MACNGPWEGTEVASPLPSLVCGWGPFNLSHLFTHHPLKFGLNEEREVAI